jgi:hypothetical protein
MAKLQTKPLEMELGHDHDVELEGVKGDERIQLERVKQSETKEANE